MNGVGESDWGYRCSRVPRNKGILAAVRICLLPSCRHPPAELQAPQQNMAEACSSPLQTSKTRTFFKKPSVLNALL